MSNAVIDNAKGVSPNGNGNGHEESLIWPEKQPLRRELPPADPYPIEALGSVLAPPAKKTHEVIQSPEAICGQSFLATATLAVQGFADLEIDGRPSPLSNNFVTIAESGERKTATDAVALAPVNKRQKDLYIEYSSYIDDYEAEISAWKKAKEEALSSKNNKTRDEKKKALMDLGPEPKGPINPILTVEEPTYEGLVKSLAVGQPSVGIFSDEGGRFLGGHGMNQENQLKTAAGISKFWDGSPITRTRAGDGTFVIYGRRVSLHLMMQPAVSNLLFGNPLLTSQGFLSRILPAHPESTIGGREYKGVSINETLELKKYFGTMMQILETPLPLAEGTQNELEPRKISMNAKAKNTWISFHNHIEKLCREGRELFPIRGLAAKAAEHAARIAGVLSLVENINAVEISDSNIQSGIKIVQFHLDEALRLFNSSADNPDLILAEKLLAWAILQGGMVYRTQIYHCGPNAIREKATATRIIHILIDHGWFRPIQGDVVIDGAKRKFVYEVRK
jgi:hypothetical protein